MVVDAGNLYFGKPTIRAEERAQQEEKARLQAAAYALSGVDAMLPGAGDLAFGLSFVQTLAREHELPYVAANLDCGGTLPFPASRTVERAGQRITIVGVVGGAAKEPGCLRTEPVAATRAALLAAPADVVVVLSGQRAEEDEALAEAVPGISLLVNGQDRMQLDQPRSLPSGGLLLGAGSRGKQLGVLTYTLRPGATRWRDAAVLGRYADQRDSYAKRLKELEAKIAAASDETTRGRLQKQSEFLAKKLAEVDAELAREASSVEPSHDVRNTLVDMGAEIADHPATAALVAAAKERIQALVPVSTVSAIAHGPFAGSSACVGCHAEEARQWSGTAHPRAWQTLVASGNERDQACYTCHVTGAFHPDGPKDPGAVAGLEAVGCEACHGPGKAHVANPPTVEMRRQPEPSVCTECHDGERDEGRFDLETYMPKVVHGAKR